MTAIEPGMLVRHVDRGRTGLSGKNVYRVVDLNEDGRSVTVYGGEPPAWRTFWLTDVTPDGVRPRDVLAFEQRISRQAELMHRIPVPRGRLRT